jgi:hypothetical protein
LQSGTRELVAASTGAENQGKGCQRAALEHWRINLHFVFSLLFISQHLLLPMLAG